MLKSHEKFYTVNGKHQLLIVDDESINREILGNLLSNDYELVYAKNGREAIEQIKANKETLSAVLLDIIMPELNGFEVLQAVRADPQIRNIPIIVVTSDQKSEVESLRLGAVDFIPKPYPQPGIILARILRTIELSEDRMIINATERDPLTELYNLEFFYQYAEQLDSHHLDMPTDAMVIDINHFHIINERFGTHYGDSVLKLLATKIRDKVAPLGGIVCRRNADTFLVYCPHNIDFSKLFKEISNEINAELGYGNRIRLRMGVYENVDKNLPIERRFDRASMACDKVLHSFTGNIGIYDSSLHEKEIYAEQLIEDFDKAIDEKQFTVYYQPKYNVKGDEPVLTSAEALVRWIHPELGFISPGDFIPLFEENGLIEKLDNYVWNEVAAQLAAWKKQYSNAVPVSVNVSRVDMFDPRLVEDFRDIVERNGIVEEDLLLEVTESAYTEDSGQIVKSVNELRALNFKIEMDDFGTGYSSLNMISELPIDALKIDMSFMRQAFANGKNTKLIEIIIDIAGYLNVPVIAEGVETEEQYLTLKELGCDIVQGYYFSKPVPAEEFEKFMGKAIKLTVEKLKEFGANAEAGLERCMNNEKFYISLVEKVLDDDSVEQLEEAINAGELDKAFTIAHTLKGSLGNLSLTPLYDAAVELTELLRKRTDTDYTPYIEKIKSLRKQLKDLSE